MYQILCLKSKKYFFLIPLARVYRRKKSSNKVFQNDCISIKKEREKKEHIKKYGILDDGKVEFEHFSFATYCIVCEL